MKKHILDQAKLGDVYAIRLPSGEHGYVRIYQGKCFGVLPVISTGLVSGPDRLKAQDAKWFFEYATQTSDQTGVTRIGTIPFADPESAWPPPRMIPPDIFKGYFQIKQRGQQRRATEAEAQGLQRAQMATPGWVAGFIADHRGECTQQAGEAAKPLSRPVTDESAPSRPLLEIVFRNNDFPFEGRDEVEEPLAEALASAGLGEVTGGGSGPETCNIDVEVSDLERGLEVIRGVLRKLGSPATTEIHQRSPRRALFRL
jgi:hypothetical protein